MPAAAVLLLDGESPTPERLAALLPGDYGHYTSFIAHPEGIRGLELHWQRLRRDAVALLGVELDIARLAAQLRQALQGRCGAQSVRISVLAQPLDLRQLGGPLQPQVLIRCADWSAAASPPLRLRSCIGVREAAQHKHLGLSGALLARRRAQLEGADDALLLDSRGEVAEGPTWSLGIYDGRRWCWPTAPALPGITRTLLQAALAERGESSAQRPLRVRDLQQAQAVFACNARHPCIPLAALDGTLLRRDPALETLLQQVWQSVPLQPLG